MRVILLGRKPVACDALRWLLARGVEVVAVATPGHDEPDPYPERLVDVAEAAGIPVVPDQTLYDTLAGNGSPAGLTLRDIDLVLSILHQKRIRRPLIDLGRLGCINFHPAPLPLYRGWGTYQLAILEDVKQWAATAHFVDEDFDTGPIIRVRWFAVDASRETALSLQVKTQPVLLALFQEVLDLALSGQPLPCSPQGEGRSITRKQIMARRLIAPDDPPDMVERKVRAFWYPPNPPAAITIGADSFPIINQAILNDLFTLMSRRGDAQVEEARRR